MFKTILIGYDGPERGDEATALAEVLCDPRTGTLLLASAYPSGPLTADGLDGTNQMLAEARDGLRKPASVQIRALASDSPGRALRETAEAEHADLVVVGSGGRSALGRPLPGTAAERVLADPPCPVAAARAYGVVDLLFVGACDHGQLRRALLDNVSGAVVRAAGCPVVVTPRSGAVPRHSPDAAVPART